MINNLFIFFISLFLIVKGATLSTKYATSLGKNFHLSKYTIGFIVVAVISILPEMFISINAALGGMSSFGLGMLFGSNIADLTLLFAVIIFIAGRGLKVESKILKNSSTYPFLLFLPLLLGFDGYFSRLEGAALIVAGGVFYYISFKKGADGVVVPDKNENGTHKNLLFLLLSMGILLVGSHFVVTSATSLAHSFGINPVLIGMLVVGLGTTIPEFSFSLRSVQKKDDSLAVGDILGTVLADATIVVGILALLNPFSFPQRIIYITGMFMVVASFVLFHFMRTGKSLSKREGYLLFAFWVFFAVVEFMVNS